MKRIIFIFSIFLVLASCKTQEVVETITQQARDSIYVEKTIVKDSIVTIILPRDTVEIYRIIKQDKFHFIKDIDTIIVEHGIVGAKAWLINDHLGVRAYVSDSTLFYKLTAAKVISEKYQKLYYSEKINKSETKTKYKNTGFAKFTIWWFIGSVIILFLFLVLKIKRII